MAEEKGVSISDAVETVKKTVADYKDEVVKKAKEEVEKISKEVEIYKANSAELEKKYAAQGASIEQIREEMKNNEAKKGRELANAPHAQKGLIQVVSEMVSDKKDLFIKMGVSGDAFPESISMKMETKAPGVITTASLGGQAYGSYLPWQPGMEPTGQIRFRDLVRTIQSDTDTVYYPQANSPIGQGSFGKQTTEGSAKAQVDRAYTMVTLTLLPFAGYTFVSRQSLRNVPFLQSWLPVSLNEQLMDAEDIDFSSTLVANATGSSTTTGITVANERLIFFIKNLIQTKFYPTAIAIDPSIWAGILVTKPTQYSLPSAVSVNPITGRVLIMGVPVYPVNWLTGGRVIVGDWTKTAIVESEGLTFRQSNDVNDNFIKNVVTFLLERVEGLAIFRKDAFITTTMTLP